jgi:hypothetical protein
MLSGRNSDVEQTGRQIDRQECGVAGVREGRTCSKESDRNCTWGHVVTVYQLSDISVTVKVKQSDYSP